MGIKKRLIVLAMMLTMLFGAFANQTLTAEAAGKKVDVKITDFTITRKEEITPKKEIHWWEKFYLRMKWDATSHGKSLKKGDYFEVTLPDNMKFPSNSETSKFELRAPDNSLVANAVVKSNGDAGGGTAVVTFTDYVESHENIKGTMFLSAELSRAKIKENQVNQFKVSVGVNVKTIDINIVGEKPVNQDEILTKWGQTVYKNNKIFEERADWIVRINFKKADYKNAVITDRVTNQTPGNTETIKYIKESFSLKQVEFNEMGRIVNIVKNIDLQDSLTFNNDMTEFTLKLGDISGKQYFLEYGTTYKPGYKLVNNLVLKNQEQKIKEIKASFKSSKSGGDAQGDLLNRIKIIKVDAENNQIKLKDAEFKITSKNDGSSFILKTDENGEAISEKLSQGQYTIDEIKPPKGYIKEDQTYTIQVTDGQVAVKTITNKRETTSIKVKKTWVGPKKDSVKVKLLADGQEISNVGLVLNEANQWQGSFDNLAKYNPDGSEIKYTVKEEAIPNYNSKVEGDATKGFTITNTNTETTEIKVKKTWVGPKKNSVTVKLLADGQEVPNKVLELNENNHWQGSFKGLAKYKADGTAIKYEIKEVKIDNYKSDIKGDAANGYTITNTNEEKTSVKVKKTWVGPKKDSVTVKLLADGQVVSNVGLVLNEANQWSGSFDNLAKYNPDGSEIKYTIEEVKIDNYESKITGSQKDGYTITNTNIEKISVEVIKKWIGKEREAIKVKLYGDGKEIEEVTITKATGWRHSFMNLKKYNDDGSEIKYTIAEEAIEGYSSEISGDASQGYVITNREKPTKPKTGDNRDIIVVACGAVLSLFGMGYLLYLRKKEI